MAEPAAGRAEAPHDVHSTPRGCCAAVPCFDRRRPPATGVVVTSAVPASSEDAAARAAPDRIVVSVCVSCRAADGPDAARPGADLLDALRGAEGCGLGVSFRAVQCLSVCKRPCTIALSAPGRYTYVFGDLDPALGAEEVLACIRTYREQEHGYMLWRERPESLRRGIVARIPPADWAPDDGSHPR